MNVRRTLNTTISVLGHSVLGHSVLWGALFCGVLLGGVASAQERDDAVSEALLVNNSNQARSTQIINVDVEDADLADVMEVIGRQVGRNILVDPTVEERVSVTLRDIAWREAVEVIARMTRCEVEERPGGILVLTQPPKVTIQFTDANVRTVLQLLAAYSGKNIIIAPQVAGQVTLDLKEVHWLRALYAIVRTVGPYEVVEETEDLLRVVPRSSIEQQLDTVVFPLQYVRPPALYRAVPPRAAGGGGGAGASVFVGQLQANQGAGNNPGANFTLFQALQSVVDQASIPGATLQYDAQTNSFIVTATTPLLRQLEQIIERVDREPTQIYAEVRFISTRDNTNGEYGIEFSQGSAENGLRLSGPFPQGQTRNFGRLDPQGQPIVQDLVGQYPFLFGEGVDNFTEPFSIPAVLDFTGLDMALNLIDRDNRSRIVQSPSLFMTDNQDAVIFVGENVPYAELRVQPDANGNVQQQLNEGQDSPVSVGFSLFLQPHVVPRTDRINMTIIPRVNNLVGSTSPIGGFERFQFGQIFIDLPRTTEQALVTNVMLDDSYTAVLGGLRTETQIEIIKKVPILSSIPILGNLFTNVQEQTNRENLTIFITPTIVRQRSNVHTIFHRAKQRLEEDDPFFRRSEGADRDLSIDSPDDEGN